MPTTFTKITPAPYSDNRPAAALRLDASDQGIVFRHGEGPDQCDHLGAREAIVYAEDGHYHLFYDGAGNRGWLACLATSTGYVIGHGGEFLQFFSGTTSVDGQTDLKVEDLSPDVVKRTLGIARTKDFDGVWTVGTEPMLPIQEQIENSSVYYQTSNRTWYLFTNHIGIGPDQNGKLTEYTDAIWVYWSKDPNHWCAENKAIVLDGQNCSWSKKNIGMPTVVPHAGRLAILYDALPGDGIHHVNRDIGLAWLELPLP